MYKNICFKIILLMQFCCTAAIAGDMAIPDAIKVPEGNTMLLTVHAIGDQVFHCVVQKGVYSWKWHSPEAKLYDTQNQAIVGSHEAGPSWTLKDGSSMKAKVIQKVDAPEKSAAPWLLLEAREHKGVGLLSQTDYVQRINTQGGISPLASCDPNHLGAEKRVAYRADYVFYGK
jgi:Protein of unknown function (DUF3455)